MLYKQIIIFCIFLLLGFTNHVYADESPLPADQAFKFNYKLVSADKLELTWDVVDGYYLYRDHIQVISKTDGLKIAPLVLPEGKSKHDDSFGDVIIYRNSVTVPVTLEFAEKLSSIKLQVQYRGCADRGICYPPQKKQLDLDLSAFVTESFAKPMTNVNPFIKASNVDDLLLPDQAFQFFSSVKDANTVTVNWKIAKGYYLYREKIALALTNSESVQLGIYSIPHGTPKEDEAFGKVEIFHDEVTFDLPLIRKDTNPQNVILDAKFQGCAERGVCYPLMKKSAELVLPAGAIQALAVANPEKISEQDQIVNSLHNDSFGVILLTFFGFGVLLSLTPCIFPMIPILSGIIVGHGNKISTLHSFLLSLAYVTASAVTYTIFGVLAALFGGNLQATFQQPWIIALFSSIFVLLSLSMFGFYDLELPNSLKTKLSNSSFKHQDGSLWGAAIMGSLSSLIVGPCVAAPLAGALIFIGQTGDALLGGGALFAMGMGMGMPLLLLGLSAGKLLPKAGSWLNSTKAIFGVLMLAVAVWMLSRILPGEVTTLLWAMLLIVPAVYLNAVDPLPPGSSGWLKLWKGLGLVMLAYGLILIIGVSLGNTNPLQPLKGLAGSKATQAIADEGLVFERVATVSALEEKLKQASVNHQPVMLDYYADWCISCKEMEAYTFKDPKVKAALKNYALLQVDLTEDTDENKKLLEKFKLIGPPAILFFNGSAEEIKSSRVIGYQESEVFLKTLQGLK